MRRSHPPNGQHQWQSQGWARAGLTGCMGSSSSPLATHRAFPLRPPLEQQQYWSTRPRRPLITSPTSTIYGHCMLETAAPAVFPTTATLLSFSKKGSSCDCDSFNPLSSCGLPFSSLPPAQLPTWTLSSPVTPPPQQSQSPASCPQGPRPSRQSSSQPSTHTLSHLPFPAHLPHGHPSPAKTRPIVLIPPWHLLSTPQLSLSFSPLAKTQGSSLPTGARGTHTTTRIASL